MMDNTFPCAGWLMSVDYFRAVTEGTVYFGVWRAVGQLEFVLKFKKPLGPNSVARHRVYLERPFKVARGDVMGIHYSYDAPINRRRPDLRSAIIPHAEPGDTRIPAAEFYSTYNVELFDDDMRVNVPIAMERFNGEIVRRTFAVRANLEYGDSPGTTRLSAPFSPTQTGPFPRYNPPICPLSYTDRPIPQVQPAYLSPLIHRPAHSPGTTHLSVPLLSYTDRPTPQVQPAYLSPWYNPPICPHSLVHRLAHSPGTTHLSVPILSYTDQPIPQVQPAYLSPWYNPPICPLLSYTDRPIPQVQPAYLSPSLIHRPAHSPGTTRLSVPFSHTQTDPFPRYCLPICPHSLVHRPVHSQGTTRLSVPLLSYTDWPISQVQSTYLSPFSRTQTSPFPSYNPPICPLLSYTDQPIPQVQSTYLSHSLVHRPAHSQGTTHPSVPILSYTDQPIPQVQSAYLSHSLIHRPAHSPGTTCLSVPILLYTDQPIPKVQPAYLPPTSRTQTGPFPRYGTTRPSVPILSYTDRSISQVLPTYLSPSLVHRPAHSPGSTHLSVPILSYTDRPIPQVLPAYLSPFSRTQTGPFLS